MTTLETLQALSDSECSAGDYLELKTQEVAQRHPTRCAWRGCTAKGRDETCGILFCNFHVNFIYLLMLCEQCGVELPYGCCPIEIHGLFVSHLNKSCGEEKFVASWDKDGYVVSPIKLP